MSGAHAMAWFEHAEYVHALMQDVCRRYRGGDLHIRHVLYTANGATYKMDEAVQLWHFEADDWGTGIQMHYAARYYDTYTLFANNGVHLSNYEISEVGGFAPLAAAFYANTEAPDAFDSAMAGVRERLVTLMKGMVLPASRDRMNQWGEGMYM